MNNRLLFLTFSLLIFFVSLGEGNKEVETKLKPQNTLLTKNEDQILLRDARETRRKKREKRKRKARKSKQKKKGKNKKNKKRRSKVRKSKQKLKKSTNKKTRKNKSMRKKEKRRTRRLKKTQRKKGQKARKARKCGRQNTIDETCLTNLVNSISFERDQVTNFLAQYNRIKNFAKLVGNKAAKKGDFSNSSSTLLEALGGNGSNPACAGQRMTRGSRNAAVDSYKKLSNCSSTIETSCLIPNGTYLPDALDTCNATYQEIKTKNKQCTTKTTNQDNACACWAEAFTLVNKAKNSTCDAKKPSDSVRKLKVACINTFSGCKKAEDASIGYIVTCRTCNSSAGECDLTTAGAGGAATTGPPPLSATAPAATTAAPGGETSTTTFTPTTSKASTSTPTTASGSTSCDLTPTDAMGPFYVKKEHTLETKCIAFSKSHLNPGQCDDEEYTKEPIRVMGKIMDSKCNPIDGAIIEYWQAAPNWSESHPEEYTMIDSSCTGLPTGTQTESIGGCIHSINDVAECEKVGYVPDCIVDIEYKAYRGWQTATKGNYELNTNPPGIYGLRPIRHIHFKITVASAESLITQMYLPQDEPTKSSNIYQRYIDNCENYRIRPQQWAKEQKLDTCPVRTESDGGRQDQVSRLKTYNWDIVLNI